MKNPNLVPTRTVTKDGVETTVYTKPDQASTASSRVSSVAAAPPADDNAPMQPLAARPNSDGTIHIQLEGEAHDISKQDAAVLLVGLGDVVSNPGYGVQFIAPRSPNFSEDYASDRTITAVTEKFGDVRLSITRPDQHICSMVRADAEKLSLALMPHRELFAAEIEEAEGY